MGPNSVGKSLALREIKETLATIATPPSLAVMRDIDWSLPTNLEELRASYPAVERYKNEFGAWVYRRLLPDCSRESITTGGSWPHGFGVSSKTQFAEAVGDCFVAWLNTEQRLRLVSTGDSPDHQSQSASLLQMLYNHPKSKSVENQIRSYVKQTFGQDIVLDFTVPRRLCFRVGKNLSSVPPDPRDARPILSEAKVLDNEGDGIRSFVGILTALLAVERPLFLIDEPESFLHPPQAFHMGELLAGFARPDRQIVIATHSADFLQGVLRVSSDVDIVRIDRTDAGNSVKVLDRSDLKNIVNDALLSSSRVFDGLFYSGAVVVEGDRDARLYQAVTKRLKTGLNLHFVNTDSKQTVPRVLTVYKRLGIRCAAIVDFDVLSDKTEFSMQLDALRLDENDRREVEEIRSEIEQHVRGVDPERRLQIVASGIAALEKSLINFMSTPSRKRAEVEQKLKAVEGDCRRLLDETKLWRRSKQIGKSSLPSDLSARFDKLYDICGRNGLFINPSGELESLLTEYGIEHSPQKAQWFERAIKLVSSLQPDAAKQPWKLLTEVVERLLDPNHSQRVNR